MSIIKSVDKQETSSMAIINATIHRQGVKTLLPREDMEDEGAEEGEIIVEDEVNVENDMN